MIVVVVVLVLVVKAMTNVYKEIMQTHQQAMIRLIQSIIILYDKDIFEILMLFIPMDLLLKRKQT